MRIENFSISGEYAKNYRGQAMVLINGKLPPGWQWVASSQNSVVAAKTGDTKVFYKEFLARNSFEKIKAVLNGSRSMRACKQADILTYAGLPTPKVLCWGSGKKSVFIITESFDGVGFFKYLSDHFLPPLNLEKIREKRLLLKSAGSLIGKLHQNGIVHGDLRQNNLLVKKENDTFRFSFIDNERNRKWRLIPASQITKNLVQFSIAPYKLLSRTDLMRMFTAYKSSNMCFSVRNEHKLLRKIYIRRNPRILKSSIRFYKATSCRLLKSKSFYGEYLENSIVAKQLSEGYAPGEWLKTRIIQLKQDKNITVNLLSGPDGDVIAKRFVLNRFLFGIKTWLKKERALNLWNMTNCFKVLDIPVALPLAYVVETKNLWCITTYFYSQYLKDTRSLIDLSQNMKDFSGWLQNKNIIPRFAQVLSKLHNNGFCHGDTKWVNILVNENSGNFWLIDLDGASRTGSKLGRRMIKDLARFIVDMIENGLPDELIDEFLSVYCGARSLKKNLVQKKVNPYISKILARHAQKCTQSP